MPETYMHEPEELKRHLGHRTPTRWRLWAFVITLAVIAQIAYLFVGFAAFKADPLADIKQEQAHEQSAKDFEALLEQAATTKGGDWNICELYAVRPDLFNKSFDACKVLTK